MSSNKANSAEKSLKSASQNSSEAKHHQQSTANSHKPTVFLSPDSKNFDKVSSILKREYQDYAQKIFSQGDFDQSLNEDDQTKLSSPYKQSLDQKTV